MAGYPIVMMGHVGNHAIITGNWPNFTRSAWWALWYCSPDFEGRFDRHVKTATISLGDPRFQQKFYFAVNIWVFKSIILVGQRTIDS